MTTEYAGAATYHATVTLPSDGDPRNAATLDGGYEDLADRTAYLKGYLDALLSGTFDITGGAKNLQAGAFLNIYGTESVKNGGLIELESGGVLNALASSNINLQSGAQLRGYAGCIIQVDGAATWTNGSTLTMQDGATLTLQGGSNYPVLSSRSEWLPCNGPFEPDYDTNWENYDGIGQSCAVSTAATCFQRETIPEHYTISKVQVRWKGAFHPTWPPANRTVFSVYKVDTAGAKTLLATAEDTNDKATYESVHALTIDQLAGAPWSATFTPGEFMLIEIVTESGTNAQIGSLWISSQKYATFASLRNT